MPRLNMIGGTPLLPYVASWCGQGQLQLLTFYLYVTHPDVLIRKTLHILPFIFIKKWKKSITSKI
jgi:hypothetical protein